MTAFISVIIANYNGKKWLKKCLDSLKKQSYKNFEVIFVDNGSSDGSVGYVREHYPKVKVVISKTNLGFAGGNNLGATKAKGEYLLLLNNDTYIEKDFINKLLKAFETNPNLAVAQSKIVLMDNPEIIDCCGAYWTDSSFLYYVGNGKKQTLAKYNRPFQVFSVKATSVLIKKSVVDEIGLFDSDFWSYYEETDFCHRAWIAGFTSIYWPSAVCFHGLGGTSLGFDNDFVQFHNFKNKLASFLKNFEATSLLSILPAFFLFNALISIGWLVQGKRRHSYALLKAIYWNFRNFPTIMSKRKRVQSVRRASDRDIVSQVKRNPRLIYYYNLFHNKLEYYKD